MSARGDWIQTYTGKAFYPLDPRPEDVDIVDIAHALSNLCRFNGHCLRFYSVAEHSVLLSRAVAPEHALWALLHDAAEAYLADVPRPTKRMLPAYADMETRILSAIAARFGLAADIPPAVKDADLRILTDERLKIMATPPQPWSTDGVPLGVQIFGWVPARAADIFLHEFGYLRRPMRHAP
jgi:uncharacterized protein